MSAASPVRPFPPHLSAILRLVTVVLLIAAVLVAAASSSPAGAGTSQGEVTRVSIKTNGVQANGDSGGPYMTPTGRFVAFTSYATNLSIADTNDSTDVYVRDRVRGKTTLVSVDNAGDVGENRSFSPSLSDNGNLVAFISNNDLAGDGVSGAIFVRDIAAGTTTRITPGQEGVSNPQISGNGQFVVFESNTTEITPVGPAPNIFVHDLAAGITELVSVDSAGNPANSNSQQPAITANGRFVVFRSDASNLVAGDTNNEPDIFRHDRNTGTTTRVSVASNGVEGDGLTQTPSITKDGTLVAFTSRAKNLVTGDTNNQDDVFVHDTTTGQTTRVSVDSTGAQANGPSRHPWISRDGTSVSFVSFARNLIDGDTNGRFDVFTHDRVTGVTVRNSADSFGANGNADVDPNQRVGANATGDLVTFESRSSNLVANDTNGDCPGCLGADVFVHDMDAVPLGRIAGTVTSAVGGKPLNGVCVDVHDAATLDLATSTTTNKAGGYFTPGLVAGDYKVEFTDCAGGVHRAEWFDDRNNSNTADTVAVADGIETTGIDADLAAAFICGGRLPTIVGTTGADTLTGTRRDDVIVGRGGNDTIKGRGGNDTICGGNGADLIVGGSGNDRLFGGAGNDELLPGSGDDTIKGGSGIDTLSYNYVAGPLDINLVSKTATGAGTDQMSGVNNVVGSASDDQILGNGAANVIDGGAGADVIDGGDGRDTILGGLGPDGLNGGPGPDTLRGGVGDDSVDGGGGNDVLDGQDGNDRLIGGWGADTLRGGIGDDIVYPGGGNDTALGQQGVDAVSYADSTRGVKANLATATARGFGTDEIKGFEWLEGSQFKDTLIGTAGDNLLFGLNGADTIKAGSGDDLFFGDDGTDTLLGGNGDDVLVGGLGNDTLKGGAGTDTASFWGSPNGVTVNLGAGTATGEGNDSLLSLEWIVGTPSPDTLTGDAGHNLIEGRGGADTIRGSSGSDFLVGFEGNDRIFGDANDDILLGDEGNDALDGGTGTDECWDGESHTSCEFQGTTELIERLQAVAPDWLAAPEILEASPVIKPWELWPTGVANEQRSQHLP